MMFTFVDSEESSQAKIKVIGAGGAGGNAVNNMIDTKLQGAKFIAINTDSQDLEASRAVTKIQIGEKLTEGLGAGSNPETGRQAAMESIDAIRESVEDSHMVFITAGLGGGTGTGAAPVVAQACKEAGILTVAVVTKPFSFEGKKRIKQAETGLEVLKDVVDTLIAIPNDRLRGLASKNATVLEMFRKADEVLLHAVRGITDLIIIPGLVNLDFSDVKTTMAKAGLAIMGTGVASGENRAIEAAERAISHPLLEDVSISGARGVLMSITCGPELTMTEMTEASDRIHKEAGDDAEIIWGTALDDRLGDELRVTVIATGIGSKDEKAKGRFSGKVRDVTEADLVRAVDLDEPTFIRQEKAVGESGGAHHRGYRGIILDGENLDTPTFMRRKAD
ncbi:MAG: cell division protein FtsZ [Desulfobacterales bacterium S3730MH5]|nr:MAG: cell division protein FtsZ [Desulfobacterales bacterium S3730MH5]OEU84217.1 MAG: cell division protein FtsZ [Desulfobacterales bacterium S5133MH4]